VTAGWQERWFRFVKIEPNPGNSSGDGLRIIVDVCPPGQPNQQPHQELTWGEFWDRYRLGGEIVDWTAAVAALETARE
jgi:hypothetical protein